MLATQHWGREPGYIHRLRRIAAALLAVLWKPSLFAVATKLVHDVRESESASAPISTFSEAEAGVGNLASPSVHVATHSRQGQNSAEVKDSRTALLFNTALFPHFLQSRAIRLPTWTRGDRLSKYNLSRSRQAQLKRAVRPQAEETYR